MAKGFAESQRLTPYRSPNPWRLSAHPIIGSPDYLFSPFRYGTVRVKNHLFQDLLLERMLPRFGFVDFDAQAGFVKWQPVTLFGLQRVWTTSKRQGTSPTISS